MNEIWKPVVGFEGYYEVSNYGRVRSIGRYFQNHSKLQWRDGIIRKPVDDTHGYWDVMLTVDGKRFHRKIHRMVAEAFIPNPENKPTVNHKDFNRKNNHVDNLEWNTYSENNYHE